MGFVHFGPQEHQGHQPRRSEGKEATAFAHQLRICTESFFSRYFNEFYHFNKSVEFEKQCAYNQITRTPFTQGDERDPFLIGRVFRDVGQPDLA
jgi:hypothetical protein